MGAEVIKVERPRGEDARDQGALYKGESVYAMAYNRNKHGITLDTRHPAARGILERSSPDDVLSRELSSGNARGDGPGDPARAQPRLVVTLSGLGRSAPGAAPVRRHRPGLSG
jgi:crotonobetainyl-CoA:carnitine CoA-transferase CaiB-like acyl-CoA transferase